MQSEFRMQWAEVTRVEPDGMTRHHLLPKHWVSKVWYAMCRGPFVVHCWCSWEDGKTKFNAEHLPPPPPWEEAYVFRLSGRTAVMHHVDGAGLCN